MANKKTLLNLHETCQLFNALHMDVLLLVFLVALMFDVWTLVLKRNC